MNNENEDDFEPSCGSGPRDIHEESVKCPRCGYSFITKASGKQKLRTRVLVFVDNGNVMGICPKCKANLKVPVSFRGSPASEHAGAARQRSEKPGSKPGGAGDAAS